MILLPELPGAAGGGDSDWPSLPPAPMPRVQAGSAGGFARVADSPLTAAPLSPRMAEDIGPLTALASSLSAGQIPPAHLVVTHDLIDAAATMMPTARSGQGIAMSVESADCPWQPQHRLVRIVVASGSPTTRPAGATTRPSDVPTTRPAVAATDVGLQIEFNPTRAAGYRLIGYESGRTESGNSFLAEADHPRVRLVEGQMATVLYEVVPAGLPVPADPAETGRQGLKYQQLAPSPGAPVGELLTATVQWRDPRTQAAQVLQQAADHESRPAAGASADFRAAAAAATIGLWLHRPPYSAAASPALAAELAATLDAAGPHAALPGIAAKLRELAKYSTEKSD